MENWKFALNSIMSYKMRAFLTMLGIIIGVASVTLIVALGDGMKSMLQDIYKDQKQNAALHYVPDNDPDKISEPVVIK